MPRWSARRAWARTMSRIVMTGNREPYGRPSSGAATPGRSSPGTRRARWSRRRTSGRCRSAGPGRPSPPTSPASGGPARPAGGVAVTGPRVAQQHGVRAVGVERAPRLVGDGDVAQRRAAVERERMVGGEREEPPLTRRVAGPPRAGHRQRFVALASSSRDARRRIAAPNAGCRIAPTTSRLVGGGTLGRSPRLPGPVRAARDAATNRP